MRLLQIIILFLFSLGLTAQSGKGNWHLDVEPSANQVKAWDGAKAIPSNILRWSNGEYWADTTFHANEVFIQRMESDSSAINRLYVQSRNCLISNGSGLLENNYNFKWSSFDQSDTPIGTFGSFRYEGGQMTQYSEERIAVDIEKEYIISTWAKAGDLGGVNIASPNNQYFGFVSYDIDGVIITPYNFRERSPAGSTRTEITQDLDLGDTYIQLPAGAAASWHSGGSAFLSNVAFYPDRGDGTFGFTASTGFKHEEYGFTRELDGLTNSTGGGGFTYASVDLVNDRLILSSPYTGKEYAAGTKIKNTFGGGSYSYNVLSNFPLTNEWVRYNGNISGSYEFAEMSLDVSTKFRPGTAYISLLWLSNYQSTTPGVVRYAGLSLCENDQDTDQQALSISGNQLSIDNGNTVTIPTYSGPIIPSPTINGTMLKANLTTGEWEETTLTTNGNNNIYFPNTQSTAFIGIQGKSAIRFDDGWISIPSHFSSGTIPTLSGNGMIYTDFSQGLGLHSTMLRQNDRTEAIQTRNTQTLSFDNAATGTAINSNSKYWRFSGSSNTVTRELDGALWLDGETLIVRAQSNDSGNGQGSVILNAQAGFGFEVDGVNTTVTNTYTMPIRGIVRITKLGSTFVIDE